MARMFTRLVTVSVALFAPSFAWAHTGHGDAASLFAGLAHPIGGMDHLLAMVAVGLLAAHLGGRALWAVPGAFVITMAAGAMLAWLGLSLPFVESAIIASVIVLGLLIFSGVSAPALVAMALVGFFATFHGFAHGSEMPADGSGLLYGLGFVSATTLLHTAGIGLGLATARLGDLAGYRLARASGAAIALAGIAIAFA